MVPSPESVETLPGRVEARYWWPATVSARMEREGDDVRYEVAMADALPQRWFAVGEQAWLGVSAEGELSRIVARAPVPARERITLRLPAERYAASLSGGRFLHVELKPSGVAEGWPASAEAYRPDAWFEAARGNGSLTLGHGGVFETLLVHDVAERGMAGFNRDAPAVGAVEGWQDWPADLRGSWWCEQDR